MPYELALATSQLAAVQPSPRAAEITAEPPERATLTEVTAPSALGRPKASASPLSAARRFSLAETPSLAACEAGSYQQVTACGAAVKSAARAAPDWAYCSEAAPS